MIDLLIMALAVYRLALIPSKDTISNGFRDAIGRKAAGSRAWKFLADLVGCPLCLGVWFSGLILLLWIIPYGKLVVYLFAIAGAQYFIQCITFALPREDE